MKPGIVRKPITFVPGGSEIGFRKQ